MHNTLPSLSPTGDMSLSEEFEVPEERKGEAIAALSYQERRAAVLGGRSYKVVFQYLTYWVVIDKACACAGG